MNLPINQIINGDALNVLKTLPDESIDCSVSSPPYWALRSYGEDVVSIFDGDENCEHKFEIKERQLHSGTSDPQWEKDMSRGIRGKADWKTEDGFCRKCGAWKGQLGLEPDFNLYIKHLCDIYDEVFRVLKKSGTVFVNLGDTYYTKSGGSFENDNISKKNKEEVSNTTGINKANELRGRGLLKDKCLTLVPERFVIEMVSRGWILRNRIVWYKRNAMPTSVKDRLGNRWEYVFFFVKNRKYFFDLDSIRKPYRVREAVKGTLQQKFGDKYNATEKEKETYDDKYKDDLLNKIYSVGVRMKRQEDRKIDQTAEFFKQKGSGGNTNLPYKPKFDEEWNKQKENVYGNDDKTSRRSRVVAFLNSKDNNYSNPRGGNPGDVIFQRDEDFWDVTTKGFKGAHFATFPCELIETPIKAGCPEFVCSKCGKPREKIYKYNNLKENGHGKMFKKDEPYAVQHREGEILVRDLPQKEDILKYLRKWKILSNSQIAEKMDLPVTSVSHWFSDLDSTHGFSYPTKEQWIKLKELFNFDDVYDSAMTQEYYKPAGVMDNEYKEVGLSDCGCNAGFSGGIVLDPFIGSGTTAVVALKQNKNFIGIELNPEYIKLAEERLKPYKSQLKIEDFQNV